MKNNIKYIIVQNCCMSLKTGDETYNMHCLESL